MAGQPDPTTPAGRRRWHSWLARGRRRLSQCLAVPVFAAGVPGGDASPPAGTSVFDVREFGAAGDGETHDTAAIQAAVDACAAAGGAGQVRFPPGRYLTGTVWLRSGVAIKLDEGARVVGTVDLAAYSRPEPPAFMPEAKWGNWHRGLFVAQGAEDITIAGPGVIDGAKVFDPQGEERMRGPHTIVFSECQNMVVRDLTVVDSANYAVFFMASDDVSFERVKFVGGWDGVHWRGAPDRPCRRVDVVDCQFFTGDDAIAGRYWEDTLITGCVINSSCNGIRLIGPARNLVVHDNLFYGPGRQPHRTSKEKRRRNMLSGIILQPGAWDATEGDLDDVLLSANTMRNVASAVTLWTKPGNVAGRVVVDGLNATGVYRAALSVEGWGDEPFGEVLVRDASIEFAGGGTREQAGDKVRGPGVDARTLPAWGLYVRNARKVELQDVRLSVVEADARPVVFAEDVGVLRLDGVRATPGQDGAEPVRSVGAGRVEVEGSGLE